MGFGKIGHFGTLDPFASGLLMIGVGGAARLNDYIHEYMPKTYLAVGKLGIETPTGDYTSEISQRDDSRYLKEEIARFPIDFLQERFNEKFLGTYMQAPHKYSAAKFMGKNLHEWAREGVEVKKEAVKREIYDIKVIKYAFPYLAVKVTVSSGTYVRTLFSDMAQDLGTLGSLISLSRMSVGQVDFKNALKLHAWPKDKAPDFFNQGMRVDDVLKFSKIILNDEETKAFRNGAFLSFSKLVSEGHSILSDDLFWILDTENTLLGLAEKNSDNQLRPKINFHLVEQEQVSSPDDLE